MTDGAERPVILDFGMHEGEDTELYLACGANVIAFEANKDLVEQNKLRFASPLAAGRLEIVAGAIVPPDFGAEEVTFYVDNRKSVWGTTDSTWVERNSVLGTGVTAVTAQAIDLKAILDRCARLRV